MPTFRRIEDIQAWQKAREVTKMIYALTGTDCLQRILVYEARSKEPAFRSWQILPKDLQTF